LSLRRIGAAAARAAAVAGGLAVLAGCTPNGTAAASGGGAGKGVLHVIDVNLTLHAPFSTPYGQGGGYAPPVTVVRVGDSIRFHNTDSFAHTATEIPGAKTFPAGSPFGISAETQRGTTLSGGFSSGVLQPGAISQTILVDKPGVYLFGCFFHYASPMRAAIVAQ
jgi:plastocyanin